MSDTWVVDDAGRDDGSAPLALSSPPIDCYVLDDVTEEDFPDITCARPCTDADCGCDGCADERYRLRRAYIECERPLLAESVVHDHVGEPMFWLQLGPFEHPDDSNRLLYGIDMSYNTVYSHQDQRTVWAFSTARATATDLYESLARFPGLVQFLGWDESNVSDAPLRRPGRHTPPGNSSAPTPPLRVVRS